MDRGGGTVLLETKDRFVGPGGQTVILDDGVYRIWYLLFRSASEKANTKKKEKYHCKHPRMGTAYAVKVTRNPQ
jgi:hypothetical protein